MGWIKHICATCENWAHQNRVTVKDTKKVYAKCKFSIKLMEPTDGCRQWKERRQN